MYRIRRVFLGPLHLQLDATDQRNALVIKCEEHVPGPDTLHLLGCRVAGPDARCQR